MAVFVVVGVHAVRRLCGSGSLAAASRVAKVSAFHAVISQELRLDSA